MKAGRAGVSVHDMVPGHSAASLGFLMTPCVIWGCLWWVSAAGGSLGGGMSVCFVFSLSCQCSCVLFQSAHLCLFVFPGIAFNFLIHWCSSVTDWWLACASFWSAPSHVEVTLLCRGLSLKMCLQIYWLPTTYHKIPPSISYRQVEMGKILYSGLWLHFQTGNCFATLLKNCCILISISETFWESNGRLQ